MGRGILRAVAAGLGVAILWHVAKEEEELEQQVERISLEGMIPNWTVCGVWDPLFLSEPARKLLRRTCHVEPWLTESLLSESYVYIYVQDVLRKNEVV